MLVSRSWEERDLRAQLAALAIAPPYGVSPPTRWSVRGEAGWSPPSALVRTSRHL